MTKTIFLATLLLATGGVVTAATAANKLPKTWQASRSTDPITGKSTCVVAAYDRAAGKSFTRLGGIYPIVEMNGEYGLLVGVSSGGRYRVPTGDIFWRVDDLPYREIKTTDFPAAKQTALPAASIAGLTERTMALAMSMSATSTVASGDIAWAMLDEMRHGHGLQFRQASAAVSYGLPQRSLYETGQITSQGLKPFALDASFQMALAVCAIGEQPAVGTKTSHEWIYPKNE